MSKVQRITIKNFKAIADLSADFKGCTAIITAGNNKGKTSFLKGLIDRIQFSRPEIKVKQGETDGSGELTLTDGSKFIWVFDDKKKDSLQYVTKDGIKADVTKTLGARFFPPLFDIDRFLQDTPKEQAKQLQKILGVDFTDIDIRYKKAFDSRTDAKKVYEIELAKFKAIGVPEKVEAVDLTELQGKKEAEKKRLNELYVVNKADNDNARNMYDLANNEYNIQLSIFAQKLSAIKGAYNILHENGYAGTEVVEFIEGHVFGLQVPPSPKYTIEMPDDKDLQAIDVEILNAANTNQKAQLYANYLAQKELVEKSKERAIADNELVVSIEVEKQKMIEGVSMPAGIAITADGITIDGLPLDRNQISLSKLYCTALRIAAMGLGEVKTLYFDASTLDKITLAEIETWATQNDLQLLIERPDFDGGEITYQLIEHTA